MRLDSHPNDNNPKNNNNNDKNNSKKKKKNQQHQPQYQPLRCPCAGRTRRDRNGAANRANATRGSVPNEHTHTRRQIQIDPS